MTPTERLAKKLVLALRPLVGEGAAIGEPKIICVTGFYKQKRADVMPWTGTVLIDGIQRSIGSWDTVTACVRNGFRVIPATVHATAYADFEIHATERPRHK